MTLPLLILGCAILWSLESAEHRLPHTLANLGLTAAVLLTNLALSFLAAWASAVSQRETQLPVGLQIITGIAALDLFAYFAHVLLHKAPLAWRFHRVHHSDEAVDVTTAFRQHPGESVWRVLWQLPAILLFGLPLWIVLLYLTISATNAQLEHASIRLSEGLDRRLRLVFVTPNMHKVHHSRLQHETDSNYSNIFSIWDRIFGTYTRRVDFATLRYGLEPS
ncbi:MAG TPA: sterol desaturase family protein [Thermoanaerobaculia bacterium]|nr:sterol desaturase family protein [Thermoanaerobaculia bacterium]